MRMVTGAFERPPRNAMASLRVAAGPCDAGAMPLHRPVRRLPALLATTLLLAACTAQAPFAQLSGMLLDARLDEISRSEEHTSELQSLMRISYAVFCLKNKKNTHTDATHT